MKTFDEALEAACKISEISDEPTPENIEKITRMQSEFIPDLVASATLDAATTAFVIGILQVIPIRGWDTQTVIANSFRNGVLLGVTVGIQMERNDLTAEYEQSQQTQPAGEVQRCPVGNSRVRGILAAAGAAWARIRRA
jgi:hypothetical protein